MPGCYFVIIIAILLLTPVGIVNGCGGGGGWQWDNHNNTERPCGLSCVYSSLLDGACDYHHHYCAAPQWKCVVLGRAKLRLFTLILMTLLLLLMMVLPIDGA